MTLEFADPDEVLATVKASSGRRLIGLTSLSALGVFLAYIAFTSSPGLGWQIFLLACGGAAIWMADRMRRATASVIELTPTELRDGVADIETLDRGVFAFKPSNGFLLRTKAGVHKGNVWRPGLWWRIGRRVGIGGMTPGSQTKFMSEIISAMMASRA